MGATRRLYKTETFLWASVQGWNGKPFSLKSIRSGGGKKTVQSEHFS